MGRFATVAMTALLMAGCGLSPATVGDETQALGTSASRPVALEPAPPPDDCYRQVSLPAFLVVHGILRNFAWPGPSPWNGRQGWVVVAKTPSGQKAVYGVTHGPTYQDDQVLWFDLAPTDAEIDELRCLPENLHCPGFGMMYPELGQIGAGQPPADDGNGNPNPYAYCVLKSTFTAIDTMCQAGGGVINTCAPAAPIKCVPRKCTAAMRGVLDDGCGGEICCQPAGSKRAYCQ